MKKKLLRLAVAFASAMPFMAFSEPTVTDVTAKQRYPWNGLVDITCTVSGIDVVTNGLKFAVAAVDADSGAISKVSLFWIVQDGTNSTDYAVHTNGDYRLIWDARVDLGQVICSNMVLRVALEEDDGHEKVQLWENGPYWAKTNIGADEPWEQGCYFWWGDIIGYKRENNAWVASDGSSSNFSFSDGNTHTCDKGIDTLKSEGWITTDSTLVPEHDAAFKQWGGGWRMPTDQELVALCDKCDWVWTTSNGICGYIVRGKGDYSLANIFLPAAGYAGGTSLNHFNGFGYYWSSVPYTANNKSWYLGFLYIVSNSSVSHTLNYEDRSNGRPIRPVQGFIDSSASPALMGGSVPFLLDTKTTSPLPVADSISVSWNAAWIGGDVDATIIIADNGAEVKRATGMGEFMYVLPSAGQHELTYTTYIGGVAQDEVYTATVYKDSTITVTNFVEVVVTNTVTDHITVTNTITDHVTVTNTVTDYLTLTNTITQTVIDTVTEYLTVTNTVIETNLIDVVVTNTLESVVTNTVTDYLTLTNIVTQTVTDTVTEYLTVTNTVVETNLVDVVVTNTLESVVTNTVTDYLTLTNFVTQTDTITNTVIDHVTLTNVIEIAEEPVIVPEPVQTFEPAGNFTGNDKSKTNGIIFDPDGTMRGVIQIETAKATLKGVKVKGFVIMEDGKKTAIKPVTVPIIQWLFYRRLNIETTVGKLGKLSLMFGGNGYRGSLDEMKVVSADVGKDAGVLTGSLTLKYIDAKGKVVSQKIAVGGVATGGTAAGTVTPKGGKAKVFAAEFE